MMTLNCRSLLPTRGRPALSQGGELEMAAMSILVLLGLGVGNGQPLAAGSAGTRVFAELPCPQPWYGLPTSSIPCAPSF